MIGPTGRFEGEAPHCPECNGLLDGFAGLADAAGRAPEPGDVCICLRCATPLVYAAGQQVRRLPAHRIERLLAVDKLFRRALAIARQNTKRLAH